MSDHVFVQSPAMLEHLRGKGLRHQRVTPVPMGVDMDAIPAGVEAGSPAPGASPSAVYLGTLNRLRRRELEAMVDAARQVAEKVPGFVLLIVGESEAQNELGMLERYAEENGAAHCTRFFGWQPHEEGLAIASRASVGLSPIPRSELFDMGSPTKAIEYMALGLPVVCNNQPDQEQVVRESGGGYSVEMSASAFADAILRLLRNPDEARAMGKAGKAWVAEHRGYRRIAADVARTLRTRCRPRVTG
jgi:glycosyltransferase involved in cell wall biosynthesis